LFEEGASRLKNLLFDPSSSQHEAFDDCYFYLPQLLHIALNSKLHTAALERIMLRMCLTTKQTRENLRSIRFALMMFWYVFTFLLFFFNKKVTHTHTQHQPNRLLQGYIEDQEHVRHATRLGLAVKRCVQVEPGSNRLPSSVLSTLRSSVDDDRYPLSNEERAEWKRIEDPSNNTSSSSSSQETKKQQISCWKVLKRQQRIVHAMTEAAEALRLCGSVKDRKKFLPEVLKTIPLEKDAPLYNTAHPLQCPSENPLWLTNHCPNEAHVFSTHARAPLLLVFEGRRVELEDVDAKKKEEQQKDHEIMDTEETQANLRRACRSYVLTPFGVAVLAMSLGYSGHIDTRFALGFALASVIIGIVLWRVYARKMVSLTKVTNIFVKKYSSTVLGRRKTKSKDKNADGVDSKKKKEKKKKKKKNTEEKVEEKVAEEKNASIIAIEGWVKKSGKSLLGTSFQKRFVVFFRHTRSIAWYTDETKKQKLNELSLIGYTASISDLKHFEVSVSHASGLLRNLKLRFKDLDHLRKWYTVLDRELHFLSRSISQRRSLRMQLTELSSERLERIISGVSSVSSRNSSSSLRVKRDFPDEESPTVCVFLF